MGRRRSLMGRHRLHQGMDARTSVARSGRQTRSRAPGKIPPQLGPSFASRTFQFARVASSVRRRRNRRYDAQGYHELELVTLLALLEYSILGVMVGRARQTYGVEAPATTGNPDFERYFRVHENTLESLIVFLPAVWIFSLTVNYHFGVALGLLFVIARIMYAQGYLSAAAKRGPGAIASAAINGILVLVSVIWVVV